MANEHTRRMSSKSGRLRRASLGRGFDADTLTRVLRLLGNALTVCGLGLTFLAFVYEHRQRGLGDLFPAVTRARRRAVAVVRRFTGTTKTQTVRVHTSLETSWAVEVDGLVWAHPRDEDAIEERIRKVGANVDALRSLVERNRDKNKSVADERAARLHADIQDLRRQIEEQQQADHRISTRAMSLQVLGLFAAGLGSLLTSIG